MTRTGSEAMAKIPVTQYVAVAQYDMRGNLFRAFTPTVEADQITTRYAEEQKGSR